jgi:hypothetical protein
MKSETRGAILTLCIVLVLAISFVPWKGQSKTDSGVAQTVPLPSTQQQTGIATESLAIGIGMAAVILMLLTLDLGRWRREAQLTKSCESCGSQLEDRDEYCRKCGARVGTKPSVPPTQVPKADIDL